MELDRENWPGRCGWVDVGRGHVWSYWDLGGKSRVDELNVR